MLQTHLLLLSPKTPFCSIASQAPPFSRDKALYYEVDGMRPDWGAVQPCMGVPSRYVM